MYMYILCPSLCIVDRCAEYTRYNKYMYVYVRLCEWMLRLYDVYVCVCVFTCVYYIRRTIL